MIESEAAVLKQKLERLTADFEDFTYIVSHDFKAPLRAISNLSDWVVEDLGTDLNEDVSESLRLLKSRVARMEQMLDAILSISRVARFDLDVVATDVAEVVQEVRSRMDAPEHFTVDTIGNAQLLTYREKLAQTLELLLENAARFNKSETARATVTIQENKNYIDLLVTDNGPGVAEHIQNKIFRIFSTTLTDIEPPATGKGLALARRIVAFVNGTINHEPNHQQGAAFRIIWPKKINT